jgi:starvation-inducible DNA-binding protein
MPRPSGLRDDRHVAILAQQHDDARVQVLGMLDRRVADALNLGAQARHAGWNVDGAGAGAVAVRLAALAVRLGLHAELLAERSIALGGAPCATPERVFARSCVAPLPDESAPQLAEAMVARRLGRYADGLQDDGGVAQALGDELTARLCLELADTVRT